MGQCHDLFIQLYLPSAVNLSAQVAKDPLVTPHMGGYRCESETYIVKERPTCLRLFLHEMLWARAFALESAGRSSAAKTAMTAITTNNSIKVNPFSTRRFLFIIISIVNSDL